MKVYIVRHGQSVGNAQNLRQGPNEHLTAVGRKQAQIIARRFKKIPIDIIISSPYERAKQTAEIIKKAIDKSIQFSDFLHERRNASEVIGKPVNDPEVIKITKLIQKNHHLGNWRYSDEETFNDMKKRALKLLKSLAELKKNNILLVTHGMFTRVIIACMIYGSKLTPQEYIRLRNFLTTMNTGLTLCEHKKDDSNKKSSWKLITWNDHAHLG